MRLPPLPPLLLCYVWFALCKYKSVLCLRIELQGLSDFQSIEWLLSSLEHDPGFPKFFVVVYHLRQSLYLPCRFSNNASTTLRSWSGKFRWKHLYIQPQKSKLREGFRLFVLEYVWLLKRLAMLRKGITVFGVRTCRAHISTRFCCILSVVLVYYK